MKLIDINNVADSLSWDASDTIFDALVHLELDKDMFLPNSNKSDEYLYKFTEAVYTKVNVTKLFNGAYANLICDFSSLFKNNLEVWKDFTKKHWSKEYHNLHNVYEDEYIYQLIDSLNHWLNGYSNKDEYKELLCVLNSCN